jgi:ABC-type phosphate transport system permease subunit
MTASASMLPVPTAKGQRPPEQEGSRNRQGTRHRGILFAAAAFSVFVTIAIVYVLVKESWASLSTCR